MMRRSATISLFALFGFMPCLVLLTGCPPSERVVPDVEGLPEAVARQLIEESGYLVGEVVSVPSATVPAGLVIEQDPEPDTYAPLGTEVDLVVSFGDGEIPSRLEVVFETEVVMTGDGTTFTAFYSAIVPLEQVGITTGYAGSDILVYESGEFTIPEGYTTMDLYDGEMAFRVELRGGGTPPNVYWEDVERPAEWITIHHDEGPPLTYPDKTVQGWLWWRLAHMASFGGGPGGFRSFPDHWETGSPGSGLIARNVYTTEGLGDEGALVSAHVLVEVWER